ncbi:DUF3347 domain-containing protein [Myroides ceti]|uniref:DUF3347 domain-containing protein n=1 Tax=Paenimyroides ceti TaxID=395087 RepID=A0ABT8CZM8_9FLAO|nr:DUF3347 domain-containing protein [Paenimyroides ceti]MDN3708517.1 DUF3347 domain-containing protein [Paenimyroides ceti]
MRKSLFLFAGLLLGYSALAQNTKTLFNNYINVKNALVKGDGKSANQAIEVFYKSIKGETNFVLKDALLKATEKMSKSTNLEKQRTAFNDVSTTLWQVVKGSDKVTQPVYYQYCPMKKAYWLSEEKDIKNPYYGSSMLTCGTVAETKK